MDHVLTPTQVVDAPRLGSILLRLYGAARTFDLPEFQGAAMALVGEALPFDRVWWGRSTSRGSVHRVHCSYLLGMPPDVPARVNADAPGNVVVVRSTQTPDRAHRFGLPDLQAQPGTAAVAAYMDIAQALCIARFDGPGGMMSFVSVARADASPAFTAAEAGFLELVMPHLSMALEICCTGQLARLQQGGHDAVLAADPCGWIHVAEPRAAAMLRDEFAGWCGPRLPERLAACVAARRSLYIGRRVRAEMRWSGEYCLLALRPREAGDLLTQRERAVAVAYCTGRSHKEVAQTLVLSPATVRHHLRNVYLKLGVRDKGALAVRLRLQ